MPPVFVLHSLTDTFRGCDAPDSDFRLCPTHKEVSDQIDVLLASVTEDDLKDYVWHSKPLLASRSLFFNKLRGNWKLVPDRSEESISGDWVRHVFDLVPIPGESDPNARTLSGFWTSLTCLSFDDIPQAASPPSTLFEGLHFFIPPSDVGDYDEDDDFGYSDDEDESDPGCYVLHLQMLIRSFGGTFDRGSNVPASKTTHIIGTSLLSRTSKHSSQAVAVDVHWIYASISLHRLAPTAPFRLDFDGKQAPISEASTLFLPHTGFVFGEPRRIAGYENSEVHLHARYLPFPPDIPAFQMPSHSASLRLFVDEEASRGLSERKAIYALVRETGGKVVDRVEKANVCVTVKESLVAALVQRSSCVAGSWFFLLESLAAGRLLSTAENILYSPLRSYGAVSYGDKLLVLSPRLYILEDHFTRADVLYLTQLAHAMGVTEYYTICERDLSDEESEMRTSNGLIVGRYRISLLDGSDYPKIMSFGWLEKCYLEQNPREDFVPVTASKPAKISPIKRKSHPQEDNLEARWNSLVKCPQEHFGI